MRGINIVRKDYNPTCKTCGVWSCRYATCDASRKERRTCFKVKYKVPMEGWDKSVIALDITQDELYALRMGKVLK